MPPDIRKLFEAPKPRPSLLMTGRKVYILYNPEERGGSLSDMVVAIFSDEKMAVQYAYDFIEDHNTAMDPDEIEELKGMFNDGSYDHLDLLEFPIDVADE